MPRPQAASAMACVHACKHTRSANAQHILSRSAVDLQVGNQPKLTLLDALSWLPSNPVQSSHTCAAGAAQLPSLRHACETTAAGGMTHLAGLEQRRGQHDPELTPEGSQLGLLVFLQAPKLLPTLSVSVSGSLTQALAQTGSFAGYL